MGEAAGGAAAEHKTDAGPAAFDADEAGINRFVWNIDASHRSLAADTDRLCRILQQSTQYMVNAAGTCINLRNLPQLVRDLGRVAAVRFGADHPA
jgi:hypothetical protein